MKKLYVLFCTIWLMTSCNKEKELTEALTPVSAKTNHDKNVKTLAENSEKTTVPAETFYEAEEPAIAEGADSLKKSVYYYRIMSFEKLRLEERQFIATNVVLGEDGIIVGMTGAVPILEKLSNEDLLAFFENLFFSDRVGVYDESGRVVVQSNQQLKNNENNWGQANCWKSFYNMRNSGNPEEPCIPWNGDYCIYWDYKKSGCN